MGWGKGYRNSGITRIFNYEQALKQFNDTKPIRGREKECRPLGHRNRPHFSIKLNDKQEVECCEYNHTPSVTFRPNGEVLIKPQWVSVSSAAFIEEVLGVRAYQSDYKVLVCVGAGVFDASTKEGLVIKRSADNGNYHPVSYKRNVVHHIRRREANNVRLQYADITNYAHGYFKLGAEMPNDKEQKELFGVEVVKTNYGDDPQEYERLNNPRWNYANPADVEEFIGMMRSDDPMGKYKAIVALCLMLGWWRKGEARYKEVMQMIDRMILAKHKHEVFKEVEVPVGVVRKDIYGWAFE